MNEHITLILRMQRKKKMFLSDNSKPHSTLVIFGLKGAIRFIYFQFTELIVFERVNNAIEKIRSKRKGFAHLLSHIFPMAKLKLPKKGFIR